MTTTPDSLIEKLAADIEFTSDLGERAASILRELILERKEVRLQKVGLMNARDFWKTQVEIGNLSIGE